MSPVRRVKTRTQPCTPEQARKRLADARKFLELAELVDDEADTTALGVSSANAVLAGIAAADAACCRAFGERSRGDDHRDAVALVAQVSPGGDDAANALRRLLAVQNDAEYLHDRQPKRHRKAVDLARRGAYFGYTAHERRRATAELVSRNDKVPACRAFPVTVQR